MTFNFYIISNYQIQLTHIYKDFTPYKYFDYSLFVINCSMTI